MAVPKRKKSRTKRDTRRATHSITATAFNLCEKCGAPKEAHRVCRHCGWYKDRYVLKLEEVEA